MSWFCCCGCQYRFRGFDSPFPGQYVTHWDIDGNTASTTVAESSTLEFVSPALRGGEVNSYDLEFTYSVSGVLTIQFVVTTLTIDSSAGTLYASSIDTSVPCYGSGTIRIVKATESGGISGAYHGIEVWLDGSIAFFLPYEGGQPVFRLLSGSSASVTVNEDIFKVDNDGGEDCTTIGAGWLWPVGAGVTSITLELDHPSVSAPSCAFDDTVTLTEVGDWLSTGAVRTWRSSISYPSGCLYRVGFYFSQRAVYGVGASYYVEAGAIMLINPPDIMDFDDPANWTNTTYLAAEPSDCVYPTDTLTKAYTGPGTGDSWTATANY